MSLCVHSELRVPKHKYESEKAVVMTPSTEGQETERGPEKAQGAMHRGWRVPGSDLI